VNYYPPPNFEILLLLPRRDNNRSLQSVFLTKGTDGAT
jgi:hypothetical protein